MRCIAIPVRYRNIFGVLPDTPGKYTLTTALSPGLATRKALRPVVSWNVYPDRKRHTSHGTGLRCASDRLRKKLLLASQVHWLSGYRSGMRLYTGFGYKHQCNIIHVTLAEGPFYAAWASRILTRYFSIADRAGRSKVCRIVNTILADKRVLSLTYSCPFYASSPGCRA